MFGSNTVRQRRSSFKNRQDHSERSSFDYNRSETTKSAALSIWLVASASQDPDLLPGCF